MMIDDNRATALSKVGDFVQSYALARFALRELEPFGSDAIIGIKKSEVARIKFLSCGHQPFCPLGRTK